MFRGLLSTAMLVMFQTVAFAQQPCTTDAKHVVDELYRHILERTADAGASGWVTQLQNGTTVREVVRQLASSPEHQQRFVNAADGALANQRGVDTLYRHLLGRQPDAAGEKSYTAMAAGQGFGAVVNSLVASQEYNQSFGDWGVPGSGGLVYCGTSAAGRSSVNTNTAQTPAVATRGVTGTGVGSDNNRQGNTDQQGNGDQQGNRDRQGNRDQGNGNRDQVYQGQGRDQGYQGQGNQGDRGYSNYQMLYSDLDANRDGAISRSEWRGTPASFRQHDWNNDGVLAGDEVRVGAYPPTSSPQSRDYNMSSADRFNYLDVNNNGAIDRNEWDGSLDEFYRLDRNNDGRLTRAEMNALRASSPFNTIDANRDGRISLGEWPYSHASFDQQDVNNDGVITPNEFQGGAPTNRR